MLNSAVAPSVPMAAIPSPTHNVWHLGPFPIRAYAICIIIGIVIAVWVATKRFVARGGDSDHVWDIAAWGIVFGIIGGRLYHLASDPELYFEGKPGTHPIDALKIWDGGLGIWGAVALGFLGVYIGCRRRGVRMKVFADAAAPGIIAAQAIGRIGNYFNNELYGGPTSVPWGLRIHCISVEVGHAVAGGMATGGEMCPANSDTLVHLYQPTFLYELIWDAVVAVLLVIVDRKLRLGRGNVFALYVMGYTAGRVWIEYLRTDHANHILGIRLNVFTAIIVFLGGLWYFLKHDGFRAEREPGAYSPGRQPGGDGGDTTEGDAVPDGGIAGTERSASDAATTDYSTDDSDGIAGDPESRGPAAIDRPTGRS